MGTFLVIVLFIGFWVFVYPPIDEAYERNRPKVIATAYTILAIVCVIMLAFDQYQRLL